MKTKKAFTLVELLVVIAILAILATATIVGFTAFTQKAKQSNLEGELKQVTELLQLEDYYNDNFAITENGIELVVTDLAALLTEANCSDPELIERANRLEYVSESKTLILYDKVKTSAEFKAMWVVGTNSITSEKMPASN